MPKTKTKSVQLVIPVDKWKWFGTAGHFICGQWCRFHLTTQIGDYLISTVGEYVHPRHGGGNEQKEQEWLIENWPGEDIGVERKYETMVFKAGEPCILENCRCGLPKIDGHGLDGSGYNTRGEASEGHFKMCVRVACGLVGSDL